MANNITEVTFDGATVTTAESLYQYDYGQYLLFTDLDLPESYEVQFANIGNAETATVLGDSDGVLIPDEYLQSSGYLTAYIYLHEGNCDGETVYKCTVPVIARPEPSDYEPSEVQQDVITQAIAALNNAVTESEGFAEDSEAWAVGQRGGVDVDSSDETYNNNSKYYSEQAEQAVSNLETTVTEIVEDYLEDHPVSAPVQSVNGYTGAVSLTYSDVGALSDATTIPTKTSDLQNDSGYITSAPVTSVNGQTGAVTVSVPTKTSDLNNDSGFLTSAPVSSVNGSTGAVVLTASDVSALADDTTYVSSVNGSSGAVTITDSDTTYALSLSSATITLTGSDSSTSSVTIPTATTSSDGLMSATDKANLDAVYADYQSAISALGV